MMVSRRCSKRLILGCWFAGALPATVSPCLAEPQFRLWTPYTTFKTSGDIPPQIAATFTLVAGVNESWLISPTSAGTVDVVSLARDGKRVLPVYRDCELETGLTTDALRTLESPPNGASSYASLALQLQVSRSPETGLLSLIVPRFAAPLANPHAVLVPPPSKANRITKLKVPVSPWPARFAKFLVARGAPITCATYDLSVAGQYQLVVNYQYAAGDVLPPAVLTGPIVSDVLTFLVEP